MPGTKRESGKTASKTTPRSRKATREGGQTESPTNRRQALIDIAAELFAERGFQSTTVRDIGQAAGVLSGSLYYHFNSKENIVDEILSTFLDELLKASRAIVAENPDPADALRELIRAAFTSIGDHRAAITVLQNERRFLTQFAWFDHVSKTENSVRRVWLKVLQDGVTSGAFRPDLDPKVTYRFVRDSVWAAVRWYTPKGALTSAQLADQYLTLIMEGLSAPAVKSRTSAARGRSRARTPAS
ncbi:TetR/AcrR family transcriptional regulator [Amycolatopsis taiwanensis]|uniref:Transcriptional regulator TetR family protein n=1 Tax=Amycolatopsis taiwanensis TaxID=342230 RepID=A0A9W6R0Q0_9PSEU|nr:TetR/AcrR family transcriptional regulator [Amycolatopsis taiwanensis]GLY65410.1 putative transcriptional regulator TetR family protein [Amycolatopsis taiwanensis]